jgi:hypothetical protein
MSESRPARRVPEVAEGLPADPSAVKPVIEPTQDGAWILKMRSVQATSSGVPQQWAFYTAAGGEASLVIHTASVRDCEGTLEEDDARLRRDVGLLDAQASQTDGLRQLGLGRLGLEPLGLGRLGPLRLGPLGPLGLGLGPLARPRPRRAERPAAPPVTGDWSDGSISVNGAPTPIREARRSSRGWIGWWTSGDQIVEVQSDAVPASDISLVRHRS